MFPKVPQSSLGILRNLQFRRCCVFGVFFLQEKWKTFHVFGDKTNMFKKKSRKWFEDPKQQLPQPGSKWWRAVVTLSWKTPQVIYITWRVFTEIRVPFAHRLKEFWPSAIYNLLGRYLVLSLFEKEMRHPTTNHKPKKFQVTYNHTKSK